MVNLSALKNRVQKLKQARQKLQSQKTKQNGNKKKKGKTQKNQQSSKKPQEQSGNKKKKKQQGKKKNKKQQKQVPKNQKKQKKNKKRKRQAEEDNFPRKKKKFVNSTLDSMQNKLTQGKFRWLNEKMYTSTSRDAVQLFKGKKGEKNFKAYHQGFADQVQTWDVNPVDVMIDWIRHGCTTSDVIADLGCGEAKIAAGVEQTVHSFDLVALNDRVTVADMCNLPLENETVDAAIMCLALMGTNYANFIREANRILKKHGILKIAEVRSRFPSVEDFQKLLSELGFSLVSQEEPNDYFILFEFKKTKKKPKKTLRTDVGCLTPCYYKKR